MEDAKCKICRRQGEKLFLKGDRCFSPKCAIVRKPYPPGIHGNKKRRRGLSEYGQQLQEKQRVRFLYGVSESQFRNYVEKALASHSGDAIHTLLGELESRLDNVVFRLGFAVSRSVAHPLVSHGHIFVNGKRVRVPSFHVRTGDKVTIGQGSQAKGVFRNLDIVLKKYTPPEWLALVPESREGSVVSLPKVDDVVRSHNIKSIIEYYSR